MTSLISAFKYKPLMLSAFAWSWFEVQFIPAPMRIFFLGCAMFVDLCTGLMKSWSMNQATTSAGFQRTVVKITRYTSVIVATWFLANMLGSIAGKNIDYTFLVEGAIGFLTLIEIFSIFENVYAMDPNGQLSKFFVKPVLKFLKGKLEEHPLKSLEDEKEK